MLLFFFSFSGKCEASETLFYFIFLIILLSIKLVNEGEAAFMMVFIGGKVNENLILYHFFNPNLLDVQKVFSVSPLFIICLLLVHSWF